MFRIMCMYMYKPTVCPDDIGECQCCPLPHGGYVVLEIVEEQRVQGGQAGPEAQGDNSSLLNLHIDTSRRGAYIENLPYDY